MHGRTQSHTQIHIRDETPAQTHTHTYVHAWPLSHTHTCTHIHTYKKAHRFFFGGGELPQQSEEVVILSLMI